MKKIQIILIILLATQFNGKTTNLAAQKNQVIEQALIHTDSVASEDSTKIITKTVIMEEEENAPNPYNKWITAALAALGLVLVIVFKMLRKKRKSEKKE